MESLAAWVCRAGPERAIELLGAPSWLCARCTGFYLAIALGVALQARLCTRRSGRLPLLLLALAIASTLVQVASEPLIASTAVVRLVLGIAVGLPLGWIAGARLRAPVRRALGLAAISSLVLATFAFLLVEPLLFELAIVTAIGHALAIVTLAIVALASPRASNEGEAS
ncbi:MAG TPA: DUF2085 domain-containing protein [Nannocystaceae bacterium]|nr:DUF2085 domain-containing protein [Nannocystaceae bacterium]